MDEREVTPALTDEEWRTRFFQRDGLTGFQFDGDAVSLIRRGTDGTVDSVRLDGHEVRRAVSALLLDSHPGRFTWQDHDDHVVTAVLLCSYGRGIPFTELEAPLQHALHEIVARCGNQAARIAALLPPRPEPSAPEEPR